MLVTEARPVPHPDADSRPYWEAARKGELRIQHCRACGSARFYPRLLCPVCHSDDVEWVLATGTGTVYSYSVVRRAPFEAFADRVPYVVALVDLDEGVRLFTNIIAPPEGVAIGARVRVSFEQVSDDVALPVFSLFDPSSQEDLS